VDLDLPTQKETHYNLEQDWEVIASYPFLDASNSPNAFFRAFYVPYLSPKHNTFANYYLLRNRKLITPADSEEDQNKGD
jgi:hypothetical protein